MKWVFVLLVVGQMALLVASFFSKVTIWQAVLPTVIAATLVAAYGVFAMVMSFVVGCWDCAPDEGEDGSDD